MGETACFVGFLVELREEAEMPAGVDKARLTGVTYCHREGPGQESDLCTGRGHVAPTLAPE